MYYWYPVSWQKRQRWDFNSKTTFSRVRIFKKPHPENSKFPFYVILLIGLFMLVTLIVLFFLEILVTFFVRLFKQEDCK